MDQNTNSAGEMQISQRILDIMKVTKRWTRFLSVLGFVITGIVFLVVVISVLPTVPLIENTNPILIVLGVIVFFAIFIFIYFLPSLLLSKYASSINKLLKDGNATAMETALGRQKTFWKYVGILVLTASLVYGVVLVVYLTVLMPQFMGLMRTSTATCESQRDGVVGATRAGIALSAANEMVNTGVKKYPSTLDSSQDGPASDSNLFFDEVLSEGISDPDWSKEGNRYTFECDGKKYVFEYNPETGALIEKGPQAGADQQKH